MMKLYEFISLALATKLLVTADWLLGIPFNGSIQATRANLIAFLRFLGAIISENN